MKLITAITALALLTGSMDVEAQKRGKADGPPGGGKKPGAHQKAPEGAKTDPPQFSPAAHIAIRAFSELEKEDVEDLVEAAKEGDADAIEELQLDQLGAIETLVDALGDGEGRQLILIGMMLGFQQDPGYSFTPNVTGTLYNHDKGASLKGAEAESYWATNAEGLFSHEDQMLTLLDNLHLQLSEELEQLEEPRTSGERRNWRVYENK